MKGEIYVSIDLSTTSIAQTLDIMIAQSDDINSKAALAKKLDMLPSTFHNQLSRNSLRLADFVKMAELLGFEVTVTKTTQL
jgi:hypothetical protein